MLQFLRFISLAGAAAAFPGCWQGTTRDVSSTVLFAEGHPTVEHGSPANSISLTSDIHPARGDMVATPGTSRAGLSLLPNLLIQLDRGARMEITRLAVTKEGNETGNDMRGRFAEIRLTNGRIMASHVWGEALAQFTVVTPHGEVATPSDGLFIVESGPQMTRVTCASGWVEFKPFGTGNGVRIPPGSVGQWPSAGTNITQAEADPVAQEDLQQAVDVEQILRRLSTQKRNAFPR